MSKKIKAVLFDFDGTLFDSNRIIIESWNYTFRKFTGKDALLEDILPSFGEPLQVSCKRFFPDIEPMKIVDTYREYQDKLFPGRVSGFPFVREMIEGLKKEGYLAAIVTSRYWKYFGNSPYDFDEIELFDQLVSYEDVTAHKPSPECILKCLEKMKLSPEEAVYVGDARVDMKCARNAGVGAILVGWSVSVPKELRAELDCDYIAENPEDILKYVKSLG